MFLLQLVAQNINEWLVRELPSGLKGSSRQHLSPLRLCPADKFGGQACLANPRLPLEQDEVWLSHMHTLVALDPRACVVITA